MKYVVCVADGMADVGVEELAGKTPLEVANRPFLNEIAKLGCIGTVKTIPPGMEAATDIAMTSVFGYDPLVYCKGRGPWEAAGMGIELEPNDVAFRCNLVTIKNGIMEDYSAGHITTDEAKVIIKLLNDKFSNRKVKFYLGVGYRHLMVLKGGSELVRSTAPHNIVGKPVKEYVISGHGEKILRQLMEDASFILEGHEINRYRRNEGKLPANWIWLWGAAKQPQISTYKERFNLTGGIISAVDVIKGIGKLAGLEIINVPGATGYYDTNYKGKAEHAIKVLKKHDYCLVHIEATDEASHNGDLSEKIKAIERFDEYIVGTIFNYLKSSDYKIMAIADHYTEVVKRIHSASAVPFVMCGKNIAPDSATGYDEATAMKSELYFANGVNFVENFVHV